MSVIIEEEAITFELHRKVKTENDVVYFQKIPDDVPPTPAEKILVSAVKYEPLIKKQNLFLD